MDIYNFPDPLKFDWDLGNSLKSYSKHGVTNSEAEECFFNFNLVIPDVEHSQVENRFRLLGKTNSEKILLIAFTRKKGKIRVISARKANKKEIAQYETI